MSDVQMEMPKYKSHKEVYALEIETVNGHRLTFCDKRYAPILLEGSVFARYIPVAGDFYVVYRDGYKSFSPRKEFLDGYTKI